MPTEFKLPEVSEGVESADVSELLVAEGDVIEADQVVMELETEKAVVELPCPLAGTVSKLLVSEGDTVAVGTPLMTIEESAPESGRSAGGASGQREHAAQEHEHAAPASDQPEEQGSLASRSPASPARATATDGQAPAEKEAPPPAGPSTRRLAGELGVDLRQVPGSGPGGRITVEDVQAYVRQRLSEGPQPSEPERQRGLPAVSPPPRAPSVLPTPDSAGLPTQLPDFSRFGPVERQGLGKIARTSAANLTFAWQTIPHVTQHDRADITELEAARRRYLQSAGKNGPKITMTAILAKAVVSVLGAYPQFNASLDESAAELVLKGYYHIGIAVDTENGLLVPVVRDVDAKSIRDIAAEIAELAEKARNRRLGMEQMQGATFTITNLGGIGGTAFTPIVNWPEVAILGVSRTQREWRFVDGKPEERLMLPLSLSYDHRVINGADAARFIVQLSAALSDAFRLLIEG